MANNFISKLVFQNGSIYLPNTFIDLDIVSTKNSNINISIYPTVRVFFSEEGYIYIFVGNYEQYKVIQKYGLNGNIESNDNQILKIIEDKSDSDSYYEFNKNELKFISSKNSNHLSWSLTFLRNVLNIYISNKNYLNGIDPSISGLNFSLIASDNDMDSYNIFRIDNTIFKSVGNMGLILNNRSIPKAMKILYNSNYWNFQNSTKTNSNKNKLNCNCNS